MKRHKTIRFSVLALAAFALLLSGGLTAALADDGEDDGSIHKIVFAVQSTSVDADQDRDGRFNRYKDTPDGFVIDYLRFAMLLADGANTFDLEAWDPVQDDERYRFRYGVRDKLRVRYALNSTPMVFGNRGRTLLGGDLPNVLRIGDAIQQLLENPDGNGIPFFSEPAGVGGDNALVQGFTNDLLTGVTPFDLEMKRQSQDLDVAYRGSSAWSVGFDYQQHSSDGRQPLGSGSYQRITDVDGDGSTDYDYFFSIRGLELPAKLDYDTSNTSLWADYRQDRWFGNVKYTFSEFENEHQFLLYDNPFWFNGVEGTSGIKRGLFEFGRASLPPSNDAWNLSLTAGVDLAASTRLTATYSMGEHAQNEPFAPITTNPANIGTADLNGDGVVNAQDDPTTTAILPQLGLNATSDISVLGLRLTSRPTDKVRINASYRVYEYDGGTSSLVIPGRTEYIESRIKTDFKGTSLAFVPHYYERQNLKVEGVFDWSDDLRLAVFWKRDSYDWNQYRSTSGNESREAGNRAVSGTDDDTLGIRLFWDGPDWLDARFDYSTSERDFSGAYQISFSGENEDVRQFDIARRDRDAWEVRLDFYPRDGVTLGFEGRSWDDDYPGTVYGFLDGSSEGWTVDASFAVSDTANLFLYAGTNEADTNMHLRTKCSNCAGFPSWGVPNYDWFPSYADEDTSFGAELSFRSADGKSRFDLAVGYLDATIEQRNVNPDTPRDLGKPNTPPVGVAQAFNFPDQTNTFTEVEARYVRKLTDTMSCGLMYTFEDWDLKDFQLQQLDAYGPNFLTVDDATRYMFLDAWYGSFDAHVGQLFVKMNF